MPVQLPVRGTIPASYECDNPPFCCDPHRTCVSRAQLFLEHYWVIPLSAAAATSTASNTHAGRFGTVTWPRFMVSNSSNHRALLHAPHLLRTVRRSKSYYASSCRSTNGRIPPCR